MERLGRGGLDHKGTPEGAGMAAERRRADRGDERRVVYLQNISFGEGQELFVFVAKVDDCLEIFHSSKTVRKKILHQLCYQFNSVLTLVNLALILIVFFLDRKETTWRTEKKVGTHAGPGGIHSPDDA